MLFYLYGLSKSCYEAEPWMHWLNFKPNLRAWVKLRWRSA